MIQVKRVCGQAACRARSAANAWQVSPIADSRSRHALLGGLAEFIIEKSYRRMTKDDGRRIATTSGAMLGDGASEAMFEPAFWEARGALTATDAGRGSAWFVAAPGGHWVLRHYRRGGLAARLSPDRYLWCGERRVRAFAEWRLLAELSRRGLPVPRPVAARYRRSGCLYRCDLITERIPEARPLSAWLAAAALEEGAWRGVGAAVASLHAAGADHADLNAHNVLLDPGGRVSIIDFDRGRLRGPGPWSARNLERLHRSLRKIARGLPAGRFTAGNWRSLLEGYGAPAV